MRHRLLQDRAAAVEDGLAAVGRDAQLPLDTASSAVVLGSPALPMLCLNVTRVQDAKPAWSAPSTCSTIPLSVAA